MSNCIRNRTTFYSNQNAYNFLTWTFPEVSMINNFNMSTDVIKLKNGHSYYFYLCGSKDKIIFRFNSSVSCMKVSASMLIDSKTSLVTNSLHSPTGVENVMNVKYHCYHLLTLSSEEECFQELQKHPNNCLVLVCKIIYSRNNLTTSSHTSSSTDSLYNLRTLAAVLRNSPDSLLKEKVLLQVGEETETASKVVLCARSPVFAKMFENEMKEAKENKVIVTDIEMPVLKILVSFLYTGKLSNYDFDFLCNLYYAADKYEITELRQICVESLIRLISVETVYRLLKCAFLHNDVMLKSSVMAFIAVNIETYIYTKDWNDLIYDEPKIAAEILSFFDI